MWVRRRDPPGTQHAAISHASHRKPTRLAGVGGSPSGVSRVWGGPAGEGRLRGCPRELYPGVRAIRLGLVAADDDQGRGHALGHQLGRDQGDPETQSAASFWPTEVETLE